MLESLTHAQARGSDFGKLSVMGRPPMPITRHHQIQREPAARAMQRLSMKQVKPADIGYINAHGTATMGNDSAESKAINSVLAAIATFWSPYEIHDRSSLGAAGAIEAVATVVHCSRSITGKCRCDSPRSGLSSELSER